MLAVAAAPATGRQGPTGERGRVRRLQCACPSRVSNALIPILTTPQYRHCAHQGRTCKLKAYVVEDNATIRENLIGALEELTCVQVVGTSATEDEGLDWLDRNSADWDMVIVDLFLKQGSGIRLVQRVQPQARHQKIVVFSNYVNAERAQALRPARRRRRVRQVHRDRFPGRLLLRASVSRSSRKPHYQQAPDLSHSNPFRVEPTMTPDGTRTHHRPKPTPPPSTNQQTPLVRRRRPRRPRAATRRRLVDGAALAHPGGHAVGAGRREQQPDAARAGLHGRRGPPAACRSQGAERRAVPHARHQPAGAADHPPGQRPDPPGPGPRRTGRR